MSLLTQTIVNAIALFILDRLFSGIDVITSSEQAATPGSAGSSLTVSVLVYLVVGLVLALVTTFIKPIIKILTLPLYILTLGLFGLIVNGLVLILVSKVTLLLGFGLEVDGFWTAVFAAFVLAILTALISVPFKNRQTQQRPEPW